MGSAIDKLTGGKSTTSTKAAGAVRTGSAIDALTQNTIFPKASPLPGADHAFNPNNPDNQINDPLPPTSFWTNFVSSIPDALSRVPASTLGIKNVIDAANQMSYEDWQQFDQTKPQEIAKFTGQAVGNFVAGPFLRIGAQARAVATGGKQDAITVPFLGKTQAYSGEVAQDVDSGLPLWLAVAKQIPSIIFDTLFVAAGVQKATSPREATILSSKEPVPMKSNIIGDASMQSRSFRATTSAKPTYIPITESTVDGPFIRQYLADTKGYNPNNPLFYKLEAGPNGVSAKFVQIKPSLLQQGYEALFDQSGKPGRWRA